MFARLRFRRRQRPDILRLLDDARDHAPAPHLDERDLARLFRRTFDGAQGRIVLSCILHWGGVLAPAGAADEDALTLARKAGRRDLAMQILTACQAELPDPLADPLADPLGEA